jgi:hypothetical protein
MIDPAVGHRFLKRSFLMSCSLLMEWARYFRVEYPAKPSFILRRRQEMIVQA